jgi:hypothetical protein
MAKGIGLIGNFRGKVGNMVGYNLKDSNNKQTQGVRVYQPIVKNPKTAAQAEQRAKLLAVNATYRALKMVIDRGNESLPYGNKSRLAWLKSALKSEQMPWFEKGSTPYFPVGCQLSKGSLAGVYYEIIEDGIRISMQSATSSTGVATIGALSTAFKADYPSLKDGDQITLVQVGKIHNQMESTVISFVIDTTSTVAISGFTAGAGNITFDGGIVGGTGAVIVSRLGDNGEHLRSTSTLLIESAVLADAPYDADSKAAAIASYRASAAASGDWAEESIQ